MNWKKWTAGVAATVVSGILVFTITQYAIKEPSPPPPPPQPPHPNDVSGLVRASDEDEVRKAAQRTGAPQWLVDYMAQTTALEEFTLTVIREGKPGVTYKKVIGGVDYRATPSDTYVDETNRTCRNISLSKFENGTWKGPYTFEYYKEKGRWKGVVASAHRQ